MILRGNDMKGDFILLDLAKLINNRCNDLNLNIVYMNPYIEFPYFSNPTIHVNLIKGPVERSKINEILQNSDIYIDASINEGFGLTALEAMTAGCVPIVSNSFGVTEYMENNKNGFIIDEVNNVERYYEKLSILINDEKLLATMKKNGSNTCKKFDFDNNVKNYIDYFNSIDVSKKQEKEFTEKEKEIILAFSQSNKKSSKTKKIVYGVNKILPRSLKEKIKKLITSLYNLYQH